MNRCHVAGDAARRLPERFLAEYRGDAAWRRAVGMRNRLAHDYDAVDDELVWGVVSTHAAELRLRVEELVDADKPQGRVRLQVRRPAGRRS